MPRREAVPAALLLLAAVLWGAPALAQDRVAGDLYTNPRYGIQIAKPPAWYFVTAAAILELARQTAGTAPAPRESDPVKAAGFAVIISKVPRLGREFDPQVVVLVHELREPPRDLFRACEGLRTGMSEPETVKPTREVRLDGRRTARLDFQGLVDGALVRATALCTFRDRQGLVVVAQALASDFDAEAQTFETILSSFRLK